MWIPWVVLRFYSLAAFGFGLRGQSTVSQPSQCDLDDSGSHQKATTQKMTSKASTNHEKPVMSRYTATIGGRNQPGIITATLRRNSRANVEPGLGLNRLPDKIWTPAGQVPRR